VNILIVFYLFIFVLHLPSCLIAPLGKSGIVGGLTYPEALISACLMIFSVILGTARLVSGVTVAFLNQLIHFHTCCP